MADILIFETKSRGHVTQHCEHLLAEAEERRAAGFDLTLHLVLPERVASRISQELLAQWSLRLLSDTEADFLSHGPAVLRGQRRWSWVTAEARSRGVRHIHWLDLDTVQLHLALSDRFGPRVTHSGLLFRPSVHYEVLFGDRPTRAEALRDRRKRLLYRSMLRSRRVKTVFTFDRWFASYASTNFESGDKVIPVGEPTVATQTKAWESKPTCDRVRFLLPGSLERRKGVLQVMAAVLSLPVSIARQVDVRFVGEVARPISREANELLLTLEAESEARVTLVEGWVGEEQLEREYRDADVILLPYQRFVWSCGVLSRAVEIGKPVITQDYGLIGHLCVRRGLGIAVDTRDQAKLAAAMHAMVTDETRRDVTWPFPRSVPTAPFATTIWDRLQQRED